MIPPVDQAILDNNPDFASLYATLTTGILAPDGSTRLKGAAAKERSAVREELKAHHLKSCKRRLLIHAISTAAAPAAPPSSSSSYGSSKSTTTTTTTTTTEKTLPATLLDLLLILPPLLNNSNTAASLPADTLALLLSAPPLSELPSLLPPLAELVTSTLRASATALARLSNPSTNPSFLHRAVAGLPARISSLVADVQSAQTGLLMARMGVITSSSSPSSSSSSSSPNPSTANKAKDVQKANPPPPTLPTLLRLSHTAALSPLLRALEAKHTVVARSLESRAAQASLLAQKQETEAESALWVARREVYAPRGEVEPALRAYSRHLRDARGRALEKIRGLEAVLAEYGVLVGGAEGGDDVGEGDDVGGVVAGSKQRTMREMARVHRDMERQIAEVRADLARLGVTA